MSTKLRRGREYRFPLCAWLVWLGCSGIPVHAQNTYTSSPGKTSIYGYYDPNAPAPQAPESRAVSPTPSDTIPFLTAVPTDQFLAQKAAIAKFSQSSFPAPSQMEVSPGGPRAPGAPTPISSIPTFSWQGLNTGIQPPSPDLAVGPSDVLMAINSSIAQFTRSGTLLKSTTFQTWFSDVLASTCPSNCLLFDPWIVYDQLHGRFILLVSATPSAQQLRTFSYLLLSVSNGATYGSGWKNWALNASLDGSVVTQNWGDSWRLGFDNQAVYLSGNMYSVSGLFQYAKVRVLKKSDVYNPAATSLPYQELGSSTAKLKNADGTLAFSLVPVHQRGKPTSGAVGVLVNSASDVSILPATYLNVWRIVDPLAATLSLNFTTINGIAYNVPAPAPQLGGGAILDSGDTRILKAIYRNGFLYTARDTGYPDQATTITYDVIDTSTTKLASQARLLNANSFYPAFDIPATTPMGTQFASTNLITGTTTAPDGTLMYAGLSNNLKAGEGYYDTVFGGTNRWGDYFGGAVDPVSGGLWVSGEYAKPPITSGFGQSGTWVGYYPWLTTPAFTDVLSSSPFFDYINVLTSWQITTGCGANQFCPTDLVTRDQLAAFIIRSMLGNTFSYTTTPYFTDVPTTSPFFSFIQKMADLGLTHGCTPTTYCPSGMVSRQDAAVLIVRGKLESLFGDNFTYPTTPFFTDVPPSLAQFPYVQKMYELGLTSGCSATQFCPNSNLTRQEIAVFLDRAFLN